VLFDPTHKLPDLTQQEWQRLTATMTTTIAKALSECVDPFNINRFGDAVLAENYQKFFSLAEKLGVIKRYDD
jgi:hypothetical protein